MNGFNRIAIAAAVCCAAHAASAAPMLIATGSLSASQPDLSTQTAGALENGLAGNLFGGIGSGLAYAGGGIFIAVADRGPNATAYNPLVDDTTSYIARFQTLRLALTPNAGAGLPYVLTPTLGATTLLSSPTPLVYGSGALGTGMSGGTAYTLGSGVPTLNAVNGTSYFTSPAG